MFNKIIDAPTNEYDVEIAKIELEKIKEITKQLPEYAKMFTPLKESGYHTIYIGNTKVVFEIMRMSDYV